MPFRCLTVSGECWTLSKTTFFPPPSAQACVSSPCFALACRCWRSAEAAPGIAPPHSGDSLCTRLCTRLCSSRHHRLSEYSGGDRQKWKARLQTTFVALQLLGKSVKLAGLVSEERPTNESHAASPGKPTDLQGKHVSHGL